MKELAEQYRAWGLNVVPCGAKKVPSIGQYAQYYEQPYTGGGFEGAYGIGVLCGKTSGGLEVVDVDSKYQEHRDLFGSIQELVSNIHEELWASLVIERTPSGGFHLFYRCEVVEGNQKLAARLPNEGEIAKAAAESKKPPKSVVLVETRGMGGFCVVAPTPGYELMQGSFDLIPTISPEDRDIILTACRSLNEVENRVELPRTPKPQYVQPYVPISGEISAWDDYNQRTNVLDLLTGAGWRVVKHEGNIIRLAHPAQRTSKPTAFVNAARNYFGTFSTNTEFEPYNKYGSRKNGYSPFNIYALWRHNGDKRAAAKDLYQQGYGTRKELRPKTMQVSERRSAIPSPMPELAPVEVAKEVQQSDVVYLIPQAMEAEVIAAGLKAVVVLPADTDTLPQLIRSILRYGEKRYIYLAREVDMASFTGIVQMGVIPAVFLGEIPPQESDSIDFATGDVLRGKTAEEQIRERADHFITAMDGLSYRSRAEILCAHPSMATIKSVLADLPKDYKPLKDFAKEVLAEKKEEMKFRRAAEAERNSVVIAEGKTLAKDYKGMLIEVCTGELAIPYQLPGKNANECEWIIQHMDSDDKPTPIYTYLRMDNDLIGSEAGWAKTFRNARIPLKLNKAQLVNLNNYLIPGSRIAERLDTLGWNKDSRLWVFARRAYDFAANEFVIPNEVSIIEHGGKSFYLPYSDDRNRATDLEKSFDYRESTATMHDVAKWYKRMWGEQGILVLIWGVASGYADYLAPKANPAAPFFPLMYCQGQKGSGKSTMLEALRFFYTSQIETISLRSQNNTAAAIQSTLCKYANVPVLFDDYGSPEGKNSTDLATGIGVSAFNRRVELKRDITDLAKVQNPAIYATLAYSSNYYPKDSSGAFQNRLLHFKFDKTVFTTEENEAFQAGLLRWEREGLCTAWITEVIANRHVIEKSFPEEYKAISRWLKESTPDHEIDSRTIACYAMIISVGRILTRAGVSFAMKETEIAEAGRKAMIMQFTSLQQKPAIQVFWEVIAHGVATGSLTMGIHFDYLPHGYVPRTNPSRQIAGEVIMVNYAMLWRYYAMECRKVGHEPEKESDMRAELKRSPAYEEAEIDGKPISEVRNWRFDTPMEKQEESKSKVTSAIALKLAELEKNYGFSIRAK